MADQNETPTKDLVDVTLALVPTIENPFPVYRDTNAGPPIGSAVITLGHGAWYARLILDPHTPEAFDLDTEPSRCRVNIVATVANGSFAGYVVLTSK